MAVGLRCAPLTQFCNLSDTKKTARQSVPCLVLRASGMRGVRPVYSNSQLNLTPRQSAGLLPLNSAAAAESPRQLHEHRDKKRTAHATIVSFLLQFAPPAELRVFQRRSLSSRMNAIVNLPCPVTCLHKLSPQTATRHKVVALMMRKLKCKCVCLCLLAARFCDCCSTIATPIKKINSH